MIKSFLLQLFIARGARVSEVSEIGLNIIISAFDSIFSKTKSSLPKNLYQKVSCE